MTYADYLKEVKQEVRAITKKTAKEVDEAFKDEELREEVKENYEAFTSEEVTALKAIASPKDFASDFAATHWAE